MIARVFLAVLAVTAIPWLALAEASAADQAERSALATDNFDKLHQMLLPQDGELQWMAVPWRTSITLARHQAATQDKPLFMFVDTGAGFADALGLC